MEAVFDAPWSRPTEAVAAAHVSGRDGLTSLEAVRRLGTWGPNVLRGEQGVSSVRLFYEQVRNPLVLILVGAALVSFFAGDWTDGVVVVAIVLLSSGIGFLRERDSRRAIDRLRARLTLEARVVRDGTVQRVPSRTLVPGDIVLLSAGALVPADGRIWEATDLFVNEAPLTGEPFPAEKRAGIVPASASLAERVLTGPEMRELHDEALWRLAEDVTIFAEVDPNEKERIILALKKTGHVVGFMGDGVNDAPAMHAADTSVSVQGAVDVAREAADFVLLEKHLDILRRGILEGRTTFANTLKYILTTTSANLGNMISMAVASLFLPFLPLLASQILLNNFLSDLPAMGLAGDSVDPGLTARPRRWDMRFIRRFMVEFGLLSSVFDFLTFGALLFVFRASPEEFRTAWFVESLLTELVIALVVRTRRRAYQSRPGRFLLWSTVVVALVALALPFLPWAGRLGFVPVPWSLIAAVALILVLYVVATAILKAVFYRTAGRTR
jgi:magnesium-transporting ATPase (P-type)